MPAGKMFKHVRRTEIVRKHPTHRTAVQRIVRGMSEKKFFDTVISQSPDDVGIITHLTPIVQGDASNERVGAFVDSLHVSWNLAIAAADVTNVVRIILFTDASSIAVNPTVNNYLNNVDPHSFRDNVNKIRFTTIMDKQVVISTGGGPGIAQLRGFAKYPRRISKMSFSATSVLPRTNHLFLLTISDSGALSHPLVTGEIRYRFIDM